jgi:ketosteroid isomerase-like protein
VPSQAEQTPEERVEIARRIVEAWNDDDVEAAVELAHAEVELDFRGTLIFPGLDELYVGHEGFRRWWRASKEPWEYWRSEPQRFIIEGQKVVAPVHFKAKGRSSGVEVETDIANFWTFRNGLVVRFQAFQTLAEALEAAGISERP